MTFVFDLSKTSNTDIARRGKKGSHAFSTTLLSERDKTLLSQCLLLVGSLSKHNCMVPTPQRKQHCYSDITPMPMATIHYPLTMPCDSCKVMTRILTQRGGAMFLSLITVIKYTQSACGGGSVDWILAVTVILSALCSSCTVTVYIISK